MKSKKALFSWIVLTVLLLATLILTVYYVDPFLHYHEPHTEKYFYTLDSQRSMNDGILKHFDYDAVITGTSMTENFKASEVDSIFGVNSIKTSFSGGTYKEINDNLRVALENKPQIKLIIRGIDLNNFFDIYDNMRTDLGDYPTYLYDNNPFNDVKYIFNKDVIFYRVYFMINKSKEADFTPGITSFDDYSRWQQKGYNFGIDTVCPGGVVYHPAECPHLSEEEKSIIYENVTRNLTSLAAQYPDVEFYYFFTPYSAAWWANTCSTGLANRLMDTKQYISELILEYDNIHLFSFDSRTDITTDLNNYKDLTHYAEWINSFFLKWMHDGQYQLTKQNYIDALAKERDFYLNFDYESMNGQPDYEADYYAAALLNKEFSGAEPINLLDSDDVKVSASDTVQLHVDNTAEQRYLVFYGQGEVSTAQPGVVVYDAQGEVIGEFGLKYELLDGERHQFAINLPELDGSVSIVISNANVDDIDVPGADYTFSDMVLY